MYDVIIIGGGPAGSRAACRLAENGHRVLVLEKKERLGTKSACTGIVGQECAIAFNIEDRLILRKVNSASLFSPCGERLYLRRESAQACILDRAAFDIAMADRAQKAGADYYFNTRVTDIKIEKNQAVVIADRQGKSQTTAAKATVIACGFNSGLLGKLGMGSFKDFAIGAQADVEAPHLDEVEVYFGHVAPGFFAWLVPVVPPLARTGLLSRRNPGPYLKNWLSSLADDGKIKSADVKIYYGAIPLQPLRSTYGERLIVVGDAAGQVKPTSGGGVYYGLTSADIAAAVLHEAIEDGDLSAGRLARYERAWRKKLGQELRTGYRFRKLYERLSDRQIDRLFSIVKRGGIDEALLKAEDLSFEWHSRAIMKLLKYQVIARTIGHIRLPFKII